MGRLHSQYGRGGVKIPFRKWIELRLSGRPASSLHIRSEWHRFVKQTVQKNVNAFKQLRLMRSALALPFGNPHTQRRRAEIFWWQTTQMYVKAHKGDMHASFCVRKVASRPLVLLLVPMMLAATVAGCVQTARTRVAPSDSCSLYTGCPSGGLTSKLQRSLAGFSLRYTTSDPRHSNLGLWWIAWVGFGLGFVKPPTFTECEREHKREQSPVHTR
jgi:hypothetical protein